MTEQVPVVVSEIVAALRVRYWFLNPQYEAAWTESWSHRRCTHGHLTLIEAAKCAMPHGAGWYVFAVESGKPRELNQEEEDAVNRFRFGGIAHASSKKAKPCGNRQIKACAFRPDEF